MKRAELVSLGERMLSGAGTENCSNESRWLLESVLGIGTAEYLLTKETGVSEKDAGCFLSKIRERASGRPLQYILGKWDFFGRSFYVGEGVLIPRPETEQLTELALGMLKDKNNPAVLDLCAGSGCIGLTIAKERPDARVVLVEKYGDALDYLIKNAEELGASNAQVTQGDIFDCESIPSGSFDLIVSNPPYIPSSELPGLDREVGREPASALDGGEDGLRYYYAIKEISQRLGGCPVIAECGEGQADSICAIFGNARACEDFNSIKRFVIGE